MSRKLITFMAFGCRRRPVRCVLQRPATMPASLKGVALMGEASVGHFLLYVALIVVAMGALNQFEARLARVMHTRRTSLPHRDRSMT